MITSKFKKSSIKFPLNNSTLTYEFKSLNFCKQASSLFCPIFFSERKKLLPRSEDIKVFNGEKNNESKLTLKNNFINKFNKEFIGNGSEFYSDQDLKLI